MGSYICLFKVLYYDDISGENKTECGFCFADNFVGAVKYLENDLYGTDLVEIHHLELLESCPTVSESIWESMRKELGA